jgi:hypothetical protein
LTIDLQRQALEASHRHLEPTGRLVLHLFDPRLDLLIDARGIPPGLAGARPEPMSADVRIRSPGWHLVMDSWAESPKSFFDGIDPCRRSCSAEGVPRFNADPPALRRVRC